MYMFKTEKYVYVIYVSLITMALMSFDDLAMMRQRYWEKHPEEKIELLENDAEQARDSGELEKERSIRKFIVEETERVVALRASEKVERMKTLREAEMREVERMRDLREVEMRTLRKIKRLRMLIEAEM